MDKKKIAVIGYGGQGAWHCKQILKSDVAELAGIFDIRQIRMDAAVAEGIRTYESAEALLADPAIDAVVVATGGLGEIIAKEAKCIDYSDRGLTLEGLRLLYELNQ